MKKITQQELLLALGDVGEDLIDRADRPRKKSRRGLTVGLLAACLCLVIALGAWPRLADIRMGAPAAESGGNYAADSNPGQTHDATDGVDTPQAEGYYSGTAVDDTASSPESDLAELLRASGVEDAASLTQVKVFDMVVTAAPELEKFYNMLLLSQPAGEEDAPADSAAVTLYTDNGEITLAYLPTSGTLYFNGMAYTASEELNDWLLAQ